MKRVETTFWDLFNANSEEEVTKVINKNELLNNPKNWLPYGGNKGNFGTFESQQNNPIPALIEKVTNSIDAVLIKECKKKDINPKSSEAPNSMVEAVEQFYNIEGGDIEQLNAEKRRVMAENIQILTVGDKKTPSIIVYDEGEGQKPEDFTKTFLSLHNNNKTSIHFVQGKYNMGSTGAVVFCGDKKFQLIGSKRSREIEDGDCEFGFTLVRRHELTKEEEQEYGKATWYEYFSIEHKIASFKIKELDLGLYGRSFKTGSIVKLYSYQLPAGSRSNSTLDLWRDINQYMYNLPLPISIYEKRDFNVKSPSKVVLGNKIRISMDKNQNVKEIVSFNIPKEAGLGEIDIDVVVFKPHVDHGEFIKNKSIIFTQNGQVHGYSGQSFISHDLGFSLLKRNTLIHVNCTKIPTSIRQDLFMSNRTHLKNGNKAEQLMKAIVHLLRKSEALNRINNEMKNNLLQSSESDKDLIESILSKMPMDKDIVNLLKKDGSLDFLSKEKNIIPKNQTIEPKELHYHPTLFKLEIQKSDTTGKIYKVIPKNSTGIVNIETNVENDFFFREHDKGKLDIEIIRKNIEVEEEEEIVDDLDNEQDVKYANPPVDILTISREGPNDGKIKLIIKPTEHSKVGDEVEIRATITNKNGEKIECIFDVKIDKEKENVKKAKSKLPVDETFPALPTPKKAFQHPIDSESLSWNSPELNWSGNDIVKIITAKSDGSELMVEGIIINMDSNVLKNFFSKNRINSESDIKFNQDKYFLSIYLHSLFLFSIIQKMRKNDETLSQVEVDDFVSSMIKSYANFLMYENFHITKMAFDDK